MGFTGRLVNQKMVTSWARNNDLDSMRIKRFLGPVNAVKHTVGPDRNKRMRQLLPYHSFLVCFVVVGKVPFFNDRLPLSKRLV